MSDELRPEDARMATTLVERSPNGILVTGADGKIRMVNPALGQMVPLVPRPVGRSPMEAIPVERLVEALEASRTDEVEFAFTSGNRDLLVRVVPLDPEGGRLAILQDVTRLRRAERARMDFVAALSHELRTPATAIAGYAETLLEEAEQLDPVMISMIEAIHRNGKRLMEMFDDLLTLARLDARDGPLPLSDLALAPIVAEAADKVAQLATTRRVHIEVIVPSSIRVRANRDAMGHIVMNLLTNAVKFSYDDGVVTVRAHPRDRWVLLEVIDLGVGIDRAHHERIFERFYRVDKGRARSAGGTGLGLAIVKKLVDNMGAAIEVKSKPGSGSVFRVLLSPSHTMAEGG